MDPLTEIQSELNRVACPQCQKFQFDLILQCELGQGECLYTARCLSCGHTFEVSTETRNLHKTHPDIEKQLAELRCPHCEKVGAQLRFRCDLTSRTCLYVAACNHCGEVLHHYQ